MANSERTLATECASLELQIAAKRQRVPELLQEQVSLQSATLARFSLELIVRNGCDALLVAPQR